MDVICATTTDRVEVGDVGKVAVHRVVDPLGSLRGIVSSMAPNNDVQERKPSRWALALSRCLRFIYKKTIASIYWPDSACLWSILAWHKARQLLGSSKFDAVITVAHPFSSHLVGLFLGRRLKDIPWVCDYGDPFSFLFESPPNNFCLYGRLNRWVERKIITKSKRISVTTENAAREYSRFLSVPLDYFVTIPPLYSGPINSSTIEQKKKNSVVRLLFVGMLYQSLRNPRFLLRLLDRIVQNDQGLKLEMHFVGDINECREEFDAYTHAFNEWIFFHPSVSREQVRHYIESADVLVNIGNSTTFQFPSKIIEYVATGKPILNISSMAIECDLVAQYLKNYPASLTVVSETDSAKEVAEKCVNFMRDCNLVSPAIVSGIVSSHLPRRIADMYIDLINAEY